MGYIGAGLTRFNTADELTVTGDAEFDGNLTVKGTHITLDSATVQTVDLGDNDKIRLGDGDDLQIYHDGSHSYIDEAGTGDIYVSVLDDVIFRTYGTNELVARFNTNQSTGGWARLYHRGSERLETTATGVAVTGNATFGDNDKAIFGAGSDLQIYHDNVTGNSVINESGTGDLQLWGDDIRLMSADGTETLLRGNPDAQIQLYYNNEVKLATTATGVDVTGDISLSASDPRLDFTDTDNSLIASISANNGNLTYQTHNSNRHHIFNNGGVGIGVTPDKSLHVLGSEADPLKVQRSIAGNTAIQATDGTNAVYFGMPNGGGFSVDNDASLAASPWFKIDTSGNVGIGIASPSAVLDVKSSGTTSTAFRVLKSDANTNLHAMTEISGHGRLSVYNNVEGEGIRLDSNGISIFNGGGVSIGTSSPISGVMLDIRPTSTTRIINTRSFNTSQQYHHAFENNSGSLVGSISVSTTTTTYNTSSDYRLKENVTDITDATTRLKQLNPVRFNFIADADTTVDGFLAHEVQDIVPEAITGTKDAMRDEEYQVSAATGDIYTPAVEATYDEDGVELTAAVDEVIHSADVEQPEELAEGQQWRETTAAVMGTRSVPDYQGIDQSKLVPLLVKTIQELEARIAALETA